MHHVIDALVSEPSASVLSVKSKAAIAFLDARIAEGLAADEQTRREADKEVEEFKRNMYANRLATGERIVYPYVALSWNRVPIGDPKKLDIDAFFSAQALTLSAPPSDIIVATSNVCHFSYFVSADLWTNISR